jgi:hypothetical protein
MAHGQDRATQVAKDDDAITAIRRGNRRAHRLVRCSETAVRTSARWRDRHLRSRDLAGEFGKPFCQGSAMRDQYNPDHRQFPP